MIDGAGLATEIEVDGGVTPETAPAAVRAGRLRAGGGLGRVQRPRLGDGEHGAAQAGAGEGREGS